jgi:Protein kinase domain
MVQQSTWWWALRKDAKVGVAMLLLSIRTQRHCIENTPRTQQLGWTLSVYCMLQGDLLMRDLLRQTLAALAAVHGSNVSHRDIKPENLLLSEHMTHASKGHRPQCRMVQTRW